MGSDGDYNNRPSGRTVIPEHSISCWRVLLRIRLEYLFLVWALQTLKEVRLETIMPGIAGEQLDGLLDSLVSCLLRWVAPKPLVGLFRCSGPIYLEQLQALQGVNVDF